MNTTVIYLTDNVLDEKIAELCKRNILKSIGDLPLISVSQKPIDFGYNICVGALPRNGLSITKQILAALEIVETKYTAIAEHDCLYTPEHFKFVPPDDQSFWYNENNWLLQTYTDGNPEYLGMYSIYPHRKVNSQLICNTQLHIKSIKERIEIMSDPLWAAKYPLGRVGEAGTMTKEHAAKLTIGKSVRHLREKLEQYLSYQGNNWQNKLPNIDLRHRYNFTKCRRGIKRRYELPYWGKLEDVLKWS